MELARGIEAAFKITVSKDELMTLTDFKSHDACVKKHGSLADEMETQQREKKRNQRTASRL
jgi:hypothetical protein